MPSLPPKEFGLRLGQIAASLRGIGAQIPPFLAKATINIAKATAQDAASRTPRFDRSSPRYDFLSNERRNDEHIADGWTTAVQANGPDVTVEVYNENKRANEDLGGYTLLHVLEYGSRPHEIVPRREGGRLTFYWSLKGYVTSPPKVDHPGTRPYAMLDLARLKALVAWKQTLDATRIAIASALSGKTANLTEGNPPRVGS